MVWSGYSSAAVTIQQKGRIMITQMFKRRIAPENLKPQLAQATVLLMAAIIFVAGFRKIAELELTETQMFLGFGLVISLVLQCFILWGLIGLKRKAA